MSDLENLILQVVERWAASRYNERHGLVTSYDPKNYLAKVVFQPEGQESGWLPIETGHIGNGWGIAVGLTPGDGGQSGDPSKAGDQVIVRYQEGDFESGKIVQRVHSEKDTPPEVQSGEMVFWHQKQAKIFFEKDGTLLVQGPGVVSEQNKGGDPTQQGSSQSAQNTPKQTITFKPDGTLVIDVPEKDMSVTVDMADYNLTVTKGNVKVTTGQDYDVTAQGDINETSQGTITITAPKIVLDGQCYLGGPDANRLASAKGTIDTAGEADVSNLATKVFVK
jgi:phage baseplate assembly protein gpV